MNGVNWVNEVNRLNGVNEVNHFLGGSGHPNFTNPSEYGR